eukprot:365353-Chlamydomonas_euryale.AAC.12
MVVDCGRGASIRHSAPVLAPARPRLRFARSPDNAAEPRSSSPEAGAPLMLTLSGRTQRAQGTSPPPPLLPAPATPLPPLPRSHRSPRSPEPRAGAATARSPATSRCACHAAAPGLPPPLRLQRCGRAAALRARPAGRTGPGALFAASPAASADRGAACSAPA